MASAYERDGSADSAKRNLCTAVAQAAIGRSCEAAWVSIDQIQYCHDTGALLSLVRTPT